MGAIPTLKDVKSDFWAFEEIQKLQANGITIVADGNYRPKQSVRRSHFAAFMTRAAVNRAVSGLHRNKYWCDPVASIALMTWNYAIIINYDNRYGIKGRISNENRYCRKLWK